MIIGVLCIILNVVWMLVLVHVVVSLLLSFQVLNANQPVVSGIWQGLERLFQPIYDPIRRAMPDTRPLDLSPLVFLVGLQILAYVIGCA